MLGKKEIEEAANEIMEKYTLVNSLEHSENLCKCLFKEGVHWAIKEFQKDLWHDFHTEKTPKQGLILVEYTYEGAFYYKSVRVPQEQNWVYNFKYERRARRWLNLSDILPKQKGGES